LSHCTPPDPNDDNNPLLENPTTQIDINSGNNNDNNIPDGFDINMQQQQITTTDCEDDNDSIQSETFSEIDIDEITDR